MKSQKFVMSLIILIYLIMNITLLPLFSQEGTIDTFITKSDKIESIMQNNYIRIRNIYAAIMNYGSGQDQFDALLDQFSLGFSLYLRKNLDESLKQLQENEKEILKVAKTLATTYQKDTTALHQETVKIIMAKKMEHSLKSQNLVPRMSRYSPEDIYLENAAHAINLAKQYLSRQKPIEAIFYFRRAKEFSFQCYEVYDITLSSKYKKDLADNKDLVYEQHAKAKDN